jgi:hypothetical protein
MLEALKRATYPARRAIAMAICPSIARYAPKSERPPAWGHSLSDLLRKRLPLYVAGLRPPLTRVRRRPDDLPAWVALARNIGGQPAALATAHGLDRPGFLAHSKTSDAIARRAFPRLAEMSKTIRSVQDAEAIGTAIQEIVRWQNVVAVADEFNYGVRRPGHYFGDAEPYMEGQWNATVWPIIKDSDFSSTLEIACGHGRQSEFLRRHARDLHLVDVNEACIEACRRRFGDNMEGCRFHYHVTDGNHRGMIADDSITFACSWDAMVHFDKTVNARLRLGDRPRAGPGRHGLPPSLEYRSIPAEQRLVGKSREPRRHVRGELPGLCP